MLLENGTYKANTNGQIVIYETEKGALCAAIPCRTESGVDIKHTMTLVKQDGTVQDKTITTLKVVFGWDGQDPFWLADNDQFDKPFEIVIENENQVADNGEQRTISKIKWLNPIGGMGMKMPEMADRRSVLAKYGAKFRALSSPVKPIVTAPRNPVLAPQPVVPVVTVDDAWNACVALHGAKAESVWTAVLGDMGITGEPTPAQCAKLKETFTDDIPFDAPTVALLDDDRIGKLQDLIGAEAPKAIEYLITTKKWIQRGQGLQHLTAANADTILKNANAFMRAVKAGK
jgi:hypothetical protein